MTCTGYYSGCHCHVCLTRYISEHAHPCTYGYLVMRVDSEPGQAATERPKEQPPDRRGSA